MTFGIIEYALMAVIAIGLPVWAVIEYGRFVKRVEANEAGVRVKEYRNTIAMQWILAAVVTAVWLGGGHSMAELGFVVTKSLGFLIVAGLALVAVVIQLVQVANTTRSDENLAKLRKQLEPLRHMLPHDAQEGRWFTGLSITAGICEEVIYRGFMIALVSAVLGPWPAVGMTSILFGLGHTYQGGSGIVKTGAVGVVMGALFVISGSLLAPIVLHILIDITSGYVARRAVNNAPVTPVTAVA